MDPTTLPAPPNGSASTEEPRPDAVPFETLKRAEAAAIQRRRETLEVNGGGTLGLAISGGGIRSATFSLGILQYLAKSGLLRHLDYISTVSGGGYIGSWLYSWMGREQSRCGASAKTFQDFCKKLSPEDETQRPIANPEPKQIAFLRQYSNYLTPRTSVFSADTWLVFATWARNTILNLAILIAAFGALVLLVRLLGLGAARIPAAISGWVHFDAYGIIFGLVAIALLLPVLAMMGRNLNQISTIALSNEPANRQGEDNNTSVIAKCLLVVPAAVVYSLWLYTARNVFVDDGLLHGIAANWGILFFAFLYLQRKSLVLQCHRSKLREAGIAESTTLRYLNIIMEVVGPLAAAFATACLLRVTALLLGLLFGEPSGPWVMFTWGPPLVLASFALGVVLHLGLMGRDLPEASREWFARLRGWLLIYTAFWVVIVGAAVFGPWIVAWLGVTSKTALATMGTGWVITTVGGVLAGKSSRTGGKGQQEASRTGGWSLAEIAAHAGPYLFIAGFVIGVAFGIHAILVHGLKVEPVAAPQSQTEIYNLQVQGGQIQLSRRERKVEETGLQGIKDRYWGSLTATELWVGDTKDRWLFSGLLLLLPVLLFAGLLLSWRVDINHFSMHNFYKNRLVRCYLGASHQDRKPNPFTQFDDLDDVPLDSFRPEKDYYGPYPIVNAALNVSSGGKLQYQERKSQSFVFTPHYTGFSAETVVDEMRLGDDSGSALNQYAKDGAAATDQAQTGACGYRPTKLAGGGVSAGMAVAISGAAVNPNMGYHTSTAVSFLLTVFNVRLGWWFGNPLKPTFNGLGPGLGFLYTVRELFGLANANSSYVNLSDGGHFDNMGIYELVRRGCRYIICCDGEQDPEPSFGGIGNAIRKCRTDFGVDIDLPLEPLRKVDGFSRAHCVVGRILYQPSGSDEDQGYLVYLKTALTGDEPSDVLEYRARAPEFPHQTTGDQWFDESQFESYRRLGYHTAKKAFGAADIGKSGRDGFFKDLYQVWYPRNVHVDTHTSAHAEIYARAVEAIRKDTSLAGLDPSLFPGFEAAGVNPEWKRNEALMCTSLIQLMERVFYDLNLEDVDARRHPYVQGWIDIFTRWAHAEAFNHAWARTQKSYPERFRDFYQWLSERDVGGDTGDGRRSIGHSAAG